MKPLVTDELWAAIEPLLPPQKPRRFDHPGRKPLDRRQVLSGIIFVLKTGLSWDDLPADLGLGCGKTCRTTLEHWQHLGVWQRLQAVLLAQLNGADQIDWSRASVDSAMARAPCGGQATGPNPTDRGKRGTKHHTIVDGQGIPLAVRTSAANRHDSQELVPLLNALPKVGGKVGGCRRYPGCLFADKAYDSEPLRDTCRYRHIEPFLLRRRTEPGGLGRYRWVVERTLGWFHQFRRLGYRRDRLLHIHQAFFSLAASLVTLRFL